MVDVLITDRTLSELQGVAENRLKGNATTYFFELYTNGWKCLNAQNYSLASKAFKVIICDPMDDTIDQFNGLMAGVARNQARTDYSTDEFKLFWESLLYICDYEERMFAALDEILRDQLELDMVPTVKKVEEKMRRKQESVRSGSECETVYSHHEARASDFRISFIKKRENLNTDECTLFQTLIHTLHLCLCELQAGVITMRDVLGITRKPSFAEFTTFLQVLEVFGSGYADDINPVKFK